MASSFYTKGLQKIVNGNVDLLTDTLKVMMVDTAAYAVDLDVDEFVSAIPVGDRIATSPALASKTVTIDTGVSPHRVVFDAADTTFTAVTGDPSEALVLFKDTGDPATSPLIAYFDGASVEFTPNGNDVVCAFNASGILRLRR